MSPTDGEVTRKAAAALNHACKVDLVAVLGWELWLANHALEVALAAPRPAPSRWCCGLIPVPGSETFAVIHGSGDREMTRQQLASIDFQSLAGSEWAEHLRINFIIDG